MSDDLSREITPPETYFNRRTVLRGGLLAASAATSALLPMPGSPDTTTSWPRPATAASSRVRKSPNAVSRPCSTDPCNHGWATT